MPAGGWRAWLVAIPLAVIVFYAFFPVLDNGFVPSVDDDKNFLANPHFRGLGAAQVKWAWTTFWVGAYQPLGWLLFETQYVFCKLDPRGYHLTSLLLQVVDAVVLYVLTVALLARCLLIAFVIVARLARPKRTGQATGDETREIVLVESLYGHATQQHGGAGRLAIESGKRLGHLEPQPQRAKHASIVIGSHAGRKL